MAGKRLVEGAAWKLVEGAQWCLSWPPGFHSVGTVREHSIPSFNSEEFEDVSYFTCGPVLRDGVHRKVQKDFHFL